MSALLCGCDFEANHICEEHASKNDASRIHVDTERLEQFKKRMPAETNYVSAASHAAAVEPSPLDAELTDAHRFCDSLRVTLKAVARRAEKLQVENAFTAERLRQNTEKLALVRLENAKLRNRSWNEELAVISNILATFYRAPLSMSSVQPLLHLAEELNPALKAEVIRAAKADGR